MANPNIYANLKPIDLPDPQAILTGMVNQQAIVQKAKDDAQRAKDADAVRQALSTAGGDKDVAIQKLQQIGAFGAADALLKADTEQRAAKAKLVTDQLTNQQKRNATLSGYVEAARSDPNDDAIQTLMRQIQSVPLDSDDTPEDQAALIQQLQTVPADKRPALLSQWSRSLLTEVDQDKQNEAHLKLLLGNDPIRGAAGLLAQTKDPQDAAEEYQAILAMSHNPEHRAALKASLPDPRTLTPENFAAFKTDMANRARSQKEKDELVNTQHDNTLADTAEARQSTAQAETARHNRAQEGLEGQRVRQAATAAAGGDVQGALTPEALEIAAEQYFMTGQLPPLGMGAKASATRTQIMNRAGALHPGAKLAFNSAEYTANKSTLTQLTKQVAAVTAFEDTGLKNLKQFTDLAEKIPDTGIPWLNVPVRALSANVAGSENMAAVNAARQVALTEISRVVSNPNLTGVLSDSARQEVLGLIPESATLPQIKRVAKVLEQDMANRRASLLRQKSEIESKLGGNSTTGGKVRVQGRDGKTYEFPSQDAADKFKKAGG